ncbi:MAG: HlyD family efflux transporter periplasmic adaptor subunit [Gemmatimonadota bacterium]
MSQFPLLRPELAIAEQVYRGEVSYVVKDPATFKYFRFRALEIAVMQEFDGKRSIPEIADSLAADGLAVKASSVEAFARKLKDMGLIQRSQAEKSVLMLERLRADRGRRLDTQASYRGNILRMRWSIGDPDQWLERNLPRIRFMFTPGFVGISILFFLIYTFICVANWPVFSDALARLYTPSRFSVGMILTFYLTGIVIIAIHELGHAFTCKYFGGRVHEMGAMLIYFEPAFFCNVNDSWTFPELRQRMWVTVAGSWIQMIVAALGAMVWWITQPGTLVNEIAIAAVLIGGITTVLANANPLIPLDGYYALSDYLEVSNLRQRAFGYLAWTFKHYILRLTVPAPPADDRERKIFLVYGLLAALYITFIFWFMGSLVFGWMSGLLGLLGILLFLTGLWFMTRQVLHRGAQLVLASLREQRARWRRHRLVRWIVLAGAALLLLAIMPWPVTVSGHFVSAGWPSTEIVAPESGLVERVFATEGMTAPGGTPVIRLRSLELEQLAAATRRGRDSLILEAHRARAMGRSAEARQYDEEALAMAAQLRGAESRLQSLVLRSPRTGIVATPRLEELVGLNTHSGVALARLVSQDSVEIRIALSGAGAALVRPSQRVRLVTYANPADPLEARITTVAARSDSIRNELEVRVHLPVTGSHWRAGVTGEAQVILYRGTVVQLLWRAVQSRLRRDLLL